jgi:hypothetical protein
VLIEPLPSDAIPAESGTSHGPGAWHTRDGWDVYGRRTGQFSDGAERHDRDAAQLRTPDGAADPGFPAEYAATIWTVSDGAARAAAAGSTQHTDWAHGLIRQVKTANAAARPGFGRAAAVFGPVLLLNFHTRQLIVSHFRSYLGFRHFAKLARFEVRRDIGRQDWQIVWINVRNIQFGRTTFVVDVAAESAPQAAGAATTAPT